MIAHRLNPSTWHAEVGGSMRVQGQLCLHSKFRDSWSYVERPCLQEKKLPVEFPWSVTIHWVTRAMYLAQE